MIGTIDEVQAAMRKRDIKYIDRICPFQSDECYCGDWCPHCSITDRAVITCSGPAYKV